MTILGVETYSDPSNTGLFSVGQTPTSDLSAGWNYSKLVSSAMLVGVVYTLQAVNTATERTGAKPYVRPTATLTTTSAAIRALVSTTNLQVWRHATSALSPSAVCACTTVQKSVFWTDMCLACTLLSTFWWTAVVQYMTVNLRSAFIMPPPPYGGGIKRCFV